MRGRLLARAPLVTLRALGPVAALAALAAVTAGCHVEARVKASASTDDETHVDSTPTAGTPSPAIQPAAAQATLAAAPSADACPLLCYEARGPERAALSEDEVAQLRSALDPLLGRLRQCVSPQEWRLHGSPMMTLRLAPDGTLAQLGLDPDEARQSLCFESTGQGASASVTLPTRKVVRCHERCVRDAVQRRTRSR